MAGDSPEFIDFANPGTRKQKENTGRKRGTSRTHPAAFGVAEKLGKDPTMENGGWWLLAPVRRSLERYRDR